MAGKRRSAKDTKILYLQIYEKRKRRWSQVEIAQEFDCTTRTVRRAIKYCQDLSLDLQKDEDIQLLIDSKEDRIKRIHDRLDWLEDGWDWSETTDHPEKGLITKSGSKFSPQSEALMYREIRELEDDIVELKGLLNAVDEEAQSDTMTVDEKAAVNELMRELGEYDIQQPSHQERSTGDGSDTAPTDLD